MIVNYMSSIQTALMPIQDSASTFQFPADHYAHAGAPTEWWWHTGTLFSGERKFGFEINAALMMCDGAPIRYSQIMLTDVDENCHYQNTHIHTSYKWPDDPSKDWCVRLGDSSSKVWVSMAASLPVPTQNMAIKANFSDDQTSTPISFDLTMSQFGPPLRVWGTGLKEGGSGVPPTVENSNYYYSLTRLACTGRVVVNGNEFKVDGTTWMDHEYGLFNSKNGHPTWYLQDVQLDNGVHISNYVDFQNPPALNQTLSSVATIQFPDGTTYFEQNCTVTPVGQTWTGPDGKTYFLEFLIYVPGFNANYSVKSLFAGQFFPDIDSQGVYEGAASVNGTFNGRSVNGTGWIEQAL
jgi:predicted secreted hydrolase